jgi:hypothetical protein
VNDRISDLACSRTQDSDIEETAARQTVEREADLGEAMAPAFQPYLQLSVLFVAFRNDDQGNIASHARIPQFSAAEQADVAQFEPGPGRCRLPSVPRIVAAALVLPSQAVGFSLF